MTKEIIALNEDQRAVLTKAMKDLQLANSLLYGALEKNNLDEDMKNMLVTSLENYFIDIAKTLDYDSHLASEQEKRYQDIRRANETIRELKEKIGSSKPVDGLAEQLKVLSKKVSAWWNREGFNHVSDEKFYPYGGLAVEFHFMLDHYRALSDTPVSDRKTKAEHVEHLRSLGFQFADFESGRGEQLYLIDNENNRTMLRNLLKTRFPSIEIHSFVNHISHSDETKYIIRSIDATIYDLNDI